MNLRGIWIGLCVLALPICIFGCEKVATNVTPTTNPTSTATATATASASPTPSPSVCGTPDSANANLVVVGMASGFVATTNTTYGNIGGYAVVDPTGASPPPATGMPITQTVSGAAITSHNTIQFANLEPGGSNIVHSAVGFAGNAFPTKPYAFPAPLASPTATLISNSAAWSTGLQGAPAQTICFSQEFTLKAGTYYFGDQSFYNITTAQDVLVVGP